MQLLQFSGQKNLSLVLKMSFRKPTENFHFTQRRRVPRPSQASWDTCGRWWWWWWWWWRWLKYMQRTWFDCQCNLHPKREHHIRLQMTLTSADGHGEGGPTYPWFLDFFQCPQQICIVNIQKCDETHLIQKVWLPSIYALCTFCDISLTAGMQSSFSWGLN